MNRQIHVISYQISWADIVDIASKKNGSSAHRTFWTCQLLNWVQCGNSSGLTEIKKKKKIWKNPYFSSKLFSCYFIIPRSVNANLFVVIFDYFHMSLIDVEDKN